MNDEDGTNAEALHLAAHAPVLRRDAAIERLRDELFQSRNYWSDQFSRECAKVRDADATIARLSADLDAAHEALARCRSAFAKIESARAVLAKLSKGE